MRAKYQQPWFVHRFLLFFSLSLLVLNIYLLVVNYRRSVVVSVPDGDSLDLADGRRVRLLGLDAPERGRCGADEAREALISLVKGRHIRLKNTVRDDYGRTLANVIIEDIPAWMGYLRMRYFNSGSPLESRNFRDPFVNRAMVSEGLAKYSSQNTEYRETLRAASDKAKRALLGIYSAACRSLDPTTDCVIKGNVRGGQKTYHVSDCKNYDQIIVDLSFGDRWFCSESEALVAGYTKASGCK